MKLIICNMEISLCNWKFKLCKYIISLSKCKNWIRKEYYYMNIAQERIYGFFGKSESGIGLSDSGLVLSAGVAGLATLSSFLKKKKNKK